MTKPRHLKGDISPTGAKLQSLLPKCPVCGESTRGHWFAQVANVPISEDKKKLLTQFFGLVRQHQWKQLNEFRDWDSATDNLVAYALKGEHPNGVLIVLKDVFEVYGQDEIVFQEPLSATQVEAVSSAAALEWQPM